MINIKIEELNLSVRAYNCLKIAGVDNIKEMALIDLNKIRNCGEKTRSEIKNKISELVELGYYDPEFVEANINKNIRFDFVNSLDLSVRAKNILKHLNIKCAESLLLLDENILIQIKNAGIKSVKEIFDFIEINKNKFVLNNPQEVCEKVLYPINIIKYFCAETALYNLKLSDELIAILNNRDIYNIFDLIAINKIYIDDEIIYNEYSRLYDYFHNLAYGHMTINVPEPLKALLIYLPFDINGYFEKNEYTQINYFIDIVLKNFSSFSLREKLNSKLFLLWLNSYDISDIIGYLFNKFNLNENEKYIISQRVFRTLEDIGEEKNITRERIRQVEAKAFRKIKEIYETFPFKGVLQKTRYDIDECSTEELIFLYLDSEIEKNYFRIKKGNKLYFYSNSILNKINVLLNSNVEALEEDGYIEYINKDDQGLFTVTLEYLGLNYYNSHIFKNMSKRLQVKYAMKKLNKPISLSNSNDITGLVKMAKDLFDLNIEQGRALEAIIQDVGVRVDSGTYAANDDIIVLSDDTVSDIVAYVKERTIINSRDLFIPFGKILEEHNINNEIILYRYLKDIASDRLYFNGVSGVISADKSIGSWGAVVINYIKGKKAPISKLEICVKYSLTDAVFNTLAINFNDIIQWSSKELYLKSMLNYNPLTIEKLSSLVKEKKIVYYEEIKRYLEDIEPGIIQKNYIQKDANLTCFLDNTLMDNFIVDSNLYCVRIENSKSRIAEYEYSTADELTI